MVCSKTPPLLIVGCIQFFDDFKQTYREYVQSVLVLGSTKTGVDRKKMQSNLDELLQLYSDESDEQFRKLNIPKTLTAITLKQALASGASPSPIDMDELLYTGGTTTPSGIDITRKKS
jgi:hypothetical protein